MAKEAKLVKLSDSLGFNVQGGKTRRKKFSNGAGYPIQKKKEKWLNSEKAA